MDGHSFSMKSSDTGGGDNDISFVRNLSKISQKSRFACTCFSGQKDWAIGAVDKMCRQLKPVGGLCFHNDKINIKSKAHLGLIVYVRKVFKIM